MSVEEKLAGVYPTSTFEVLADEVELEVVKAEKSSGKVNLLQLQQEMKDKKDLVLNRKKDKELAKAIPKEQVNSEAPITKDFDKLMSVVL